MANGRGGSGAELAGLGALHGAVWEACEDDVRPLSPASPGAKRVRRELGLADKAEDDVRPMSPPRGDALLLRELINGERPSSGVPLVAFRGGVSPPRVPTALEAAAPTRPVHGVLSEEGGLAAFNDRLRQAELRRAGSGKARAYG